MAVVVTAALFACWNSIVDLVDEVAHGAELVYCYMAIPEAMCIAYANRTREIPLNHKINDRQTDWLVAVPVGTVAVIGGNLLTHSLGGYAELWRLDLFAAMCWTWACIVITFGLRPVMRHWRAWLFLLSCWPALHTLVAASLGGSPGAFALVNGLLAAWCTWLAVLDRRTRWLLAPISFALCLFAQQIFGPTRVILAAVVGMAMPIVVVAVWLARAIRRRGHPLRRSQPGHLSGVIALIFVCLASALTRHIGGSVVSPTHAAVPTVPSLMSVTRLSRLDGWSPVRPATKNLGPVLGFETSTDRVLVTNRGGRDALWVDIAETPRSAAFDLMTPTVTYRLGGTALRAPRAVDLGHGVHGSLLFTDPAQQSASDDMPWLMVTWRVRLHTGTQQRITLIGFAARRADHRMLDYQTLPAPRRLSLSVLPQTFSYVVRGESRRPSVLPVVPSPLLSVARQIVDLQFRAAS